MKTTEAELGAERTRAALEELAGQVAAYFADRGPVALVAVANGGIAVARWLAGALPELGEPGILNASFHRDDIGLKPIPKSFQPTDLPFSVDGADVLLVDDVFATGRTLRAALNELFDHGRPATVRFAVLVDTGHRRLPFSPDFVGLRLPTAPGQKVVVTPNNESGAGAPLSIRLCAADGSVSMA